MLNGNPAVFGPKRIVVADWRRARTALLSHGIALGTLLLVMILDPSPGSRDWFVAFFFAWLWLAPVAFAPWINWYLPIGHPARREQKMLLIAMSQAVQISFPFILMVKVSGLITSSSLAGFAGTVATAVVLTTGLQIIGAFVVGRIFDGIYAGLRRFARPGECLRCGYDLRGSVSGVCPECGALVPGRRRPRQRAVAHRPAPPMKPPESSSHGE